MNEEEDLAQRRRGAEKRGTRSLTANDVSGAVVDIGLMIHKALGPGLLESVYETVLCHELAAAGFHVERQVSVPIKWKGQTLDDAFRADLIVERMVIVELKSVEKTLPVHKKQVITYLKLTGLKVGLLLNFGADLFRDVVERLVNGADE